MRWDVLYVMGCNGCDGWIGYDGWIVAPTQTHILLRAPRRFVHPAWVPRLNLCRSLESALEAFVEGSIAAPTTTTVSKQKVRVGGKVEGVWVSCRDRASSSSSSFSSSSSSSLEEAGGRSLEKLAKDKEEEKDKDKEEGETETGEQEGKEEDKEEKEEDEMIWWQWDGKIVGFSDW